MRSKTLPVYSVSSWCCIAVTTVQKFSLALALLRLLLLLFGKRLQVIGQIPIVLLFVIILGLAFILSGPKYEEDTHKLESIVSRYLR